MNKGEQESFVCLGYKIVQKLSASFNCIEATHTHKNTHGLLNKAVFDVTEEYFWHECSPFCRKHTEREGETYSKFITQERYLFVCVCVVVNGSLALIQMSPHVALHGQKGNDGRAKEQ